MKFLDTLLEEIGSIDMSNVVGIEDPVAENETVIGELPDELKRLHTYLRELSEQLAQKIDELKKQFESTPQDEIARIMEELRKNSDEITAIKSRFALIHTLFWQEVGEEFPSASDKNVGIRDGFKVVAVDKKDEECDCPVCHIKYLLDLFAIDIVHINR